MTQFAGRATFPAAFTDARGNGRGGLSITVYHRPTYLDGVTNGTALLLSATAEFESSNEGLAITGEDIAPSTTIEEYLSPTSVLLSQPATGSGTGRSFQVIGRQRAEDLATVYTDRTKGVADANPFVADSAGNAWPYLDPGDYDAVTVHGITPFTVLRDPGEPVAESDLAFAIATQGELDAEAATRSAEVAALTAADATETAARIAADLSEATTRAAADTAEASARAAADALKADVPYPGTSGTAVVTAATATQDVEGKPTFAFALVKGYPHHDPYSYDRTIGQGSAAADTNAVQAALAACGTRGRLRFGPLQLLLTTGLVIPKGVIWEQGPETDLVYTGVGTALEFDGGVLNHGGQDFTACMVRVRRASVSWAANQGGTDTTSIGVVVRNTNYSHFHFLEVQNFHTGVEVRGNAGGCVGNLFSIGYLVNNKRALVLSQLAGGWTNQNKFECGGMRNDSNYTTAGVADVGTRWIVTGNANGNTFDALNTEGGPVNVEVAISEGGVSNYWVNPRLEGMAAGQFHLLPTSQRCVVAWGYGNYGPRNVPFLDEGTGNVILGSRGQEIWGDGGTFGAPSALTARALTSAADKMIRTLDTAGAETFHIDGGGRPRLFRPGEAHPRIEAKQYAGNGPAGVGGIHFGLGTAATDLSIGRTSATKPGFITSAPWVPLVALQTLVANGTVTIDASTADTHRVTLQANCTGMTLSNPIFSGHRIRVEMIQDATGGRTVVWAPNIQWAGAAAPIVTPTAGRTTIVELAYDSAKVKWVEQFRLLDIG